jgi:hypothetical protein
MADGSRPVHTDRPKRVAPPAVKPSAPSASDPWAVPGTPKTNDKIVPVGGKVILGKKD